MLWDGIAPKSASCQCPLVAAAPAAAAPSSPGHGAPPRRKHLAPGGQGEWFSRVVGRTCVLLRDSEMQGCIQAVMSIRTVSPLSRYNIFSKLTWSSPPGAVTFTTSLDLTLKSLFSTCFLTEPPKSQTFSSNPFLNSSTARQGTGPSPGHRRLKKPSSSWTSVWPLGLVR